MVSWVDQTRKWIKSWNKTFPKCWRFAENMASICKMKWTEAKNFCALSVFGIVCAIALSDAIFSCGSFTKSNILRCRYDWMTMPRQFPLHRTISTAATRRVARFHREHCRWIAQSTTNMNYYSQVFNNLDSIFIFVWLCAFCNCEIKFCGLGFVDRTFFFFRFSSFFSQRKMTFVSFNSILMYFSLFLAPSSSPSLESRRYLPNHFSLCHRQTSERIINSFGTLSLRLKIADRSRGKQS